MSSVEVQATLTILLGIVFLLVLLLPFLVRRIEHELEIFLFAMGLLAMVIDSMEVLLFPEGAGGEVPVFGLGIVWDAVKDPVKITLAVLIAGIAFHYLRDDVERWMERIRSRVDRRYIVFLTIVILGFISSVISAIIAALLLAEIVAHLRIARRKAVPFVVITCFSIGLGAALTPLGEPLSTIVISKLDESFLYLADMLWPFVVPGIILLGIYGAYVVGRQDHDRDIAREVSHHENIKEVFVRAGKVYLFVMALVFLGTGFNPLIEWYLKGVSHLTLFWVNILSAVLDNATMASAEISTSMGETQILGALLGLLIAGGMLIPGNIPNIISASKLRIKSVEWAKVGVPLGLVLMLVYFGVLVLVQAL
jgi:predicted cation transporter